ncbi:class I adenylate-forming enzyme family protein [Natrononativus amylolyticus]|uniref:class I adenylate-forming enzyme family protein n=1 Tax=Natrononativus amylolyticus TaxID=2963434 RepID=UPI0020CFDB5D|nr:class I adenylate-forming enzyme family protein [Natrononativus amylolyticus]
MRAPVDWPTADLLTHRSRATPERTAIVDADTDDAWTCREFSRRADDAAIGLERRGADGRVGFLLEAGLEFAAAFFGAMRLGTTVVPLNLAETASELEAKVDGLDLDGLVCEPDTEGLAVDLANGATLERAPVLSTGEPSADAVESLYGAVSGRGVSPVALERGDTQLILFTSGTSGEPKAVRLTVGNLVASATASAFRLGVLPEDRWLCCLPMYHMGGLAPVVRSALYGTTAVVQREFDAEATARVLDEYEVTGVSLVPTMLKRLLEAGWSAPVRLRFVLLGGAPASSDLLDRCRRRGVPAHPTYGMTETASQIATATPAQAATHEGTVGQPLVCTDVTVVGEDGTPVGAGETGELVVSGPTVTPGYLEADRTEAAFGEYGLHTGDVGYRDADGRLWVLNRRSDRIITGGENVDPGEVVDVLRSHPLVEAAAVVGLPDDEWGERVAALVVLEAGTGDESPALEALRDHWRERLAGFKRPKTIAVAEGLPRTASGTVDREAVRDVLRERGIDAGTLG